METNKCKNQCPLGGDITNDCADCIYSGEFHFVDGECVKREEYEPSSTNGDYGPGNPYDAPGMAPYMFL